MLLRCYLSTKRIDRYEVTCVEHASKDLMLGSWLLAQAGPALKGRIVGCKTSAKGEARKLYSSKPQSQYNLDALERHGNPNELTI